MSSVCDGLPVETRLSLGLTGCRLRRRLGVGNQGVRLDPARILGHHHGVASCDRHVLLRPVFDVVLRCQHVVRRGQLQVVSGQHQHRLINVIDSAISLGGVGLGEDLDVALGLEPIDLVAA